MNVGRLGCTWGIINLVEKNAFSTNNEVISDTRRECSDVKGAFSDGE